MLTWLMDYTIGTLFDYVATKIIIKYFNCYFKNHIHIIKSKSEHWKNRMIFKRKNKMNLTKWNIGELGVIFFLMIYS